MCFSKLRMKKNEASFHCKYLLGSAKICFGISVYGGNSDHSLSSCKVLNVVAKTSLLFLLCFLTDCMK